MNIEVKRNGTSLTITADGRLDTETSPELETAIKNNIEGVTRLTFDFRNLEHLTSSGLRVLVAAQRIMDKQGEMVILPVTEAVRDVFALTGMLDIFTVLD